MSASKNEKENNPEMNVNGIKNICSKYKKYIATGAMLVLLCVVVATLGKKDGTAKPDEGKSAVTNVDENTSTDGAEVDAHEEVNALFGEYYTHYAAGDIESLEKIAFPITDTEKSYIQMFSKYVDKYENIKCYTTKGISDGEYVAVVTTEMKLKDIDTAAPELATFYVRKNENGVYIDNAYSSFNQSNEENSRDTEVNELITEFGQDADIIKLQRDFQEGYDKALEKDEELKVMITSTVQSAIKEWVAAVGPSEEEGGKDTGKDSQGGQDNQTEVKTRTAYAKTKVNLRKKRSTSSEILQTLSPGTEVTIYGTSRDGWFKVKCNGKTGFVSKEYIVSDKSKVEKEEPKKETNVKTRTAYAKTTVNLRKKRSTSSDILMTMKPGTKVTIYGTSKNGWFKVKCNGKTGFVSKEYIVSDKSKVEKEDSSSGTKKRVAYAKTGVNMRKKRSTDSDVVQLLDAGTKVMIYGTSKNGWFKVRSKGKFGYVKKEFIVSSKAKVDEIEPEQQPSTSTGRTYYNEGDTITLTDSVNVRVSMSETSDRVGLAYKGDALTVVMSYAEGWTKVTWNGQTGFVKTEYLK